MLVLDLKKDWQTYIETELRSMGFQFTQLEDLDVATSRYFNIKRRILSQRIRKIHESQELQIPPQYSRGYCELKECIIAGANLRPYLSRQIIETKKRENLRQLNLIYN